MLQSFNQSVVTCLCLLVLQMTDIDMDDVVCDDPADEYIPQGTGLTFVHSVLMI